MTGQVIAAPKDIAAGPRPAMREPRWDNPDRSAAFGKAIEEALTQFSRARPAPGDAAEPAAGEPAMTGPPTEPGRSTDWRAPDAPLTVTAPVEPPAGGPPAAMTEPAGPARGVPVAQLLAALALEGYAAPRAAPPATEGTTPADAMPQPATRPPVSPIAAPPMPPVVPGRSAPDEASPLREPLPVTVVSAVAHPPPPPPVPAQVAAALGGDLAAMAASAPAHNGRPQSPARLLTIALDPPELGSLLVRLKLTGRGLEVAIAAQPQSVATVREGLDGIARALHDKGIAVEALNVRVADWRELAAVVSAPRADPAAASPAQTGSQPLSGGDPGFGETAGGESFGNRRGAAGDGERPPHGRERRESGDGDRQTLGNVGAGDGRYV